ncbi:MAG TPA: hypothetical protein VGI05_15275 [Streptosporangiaceae bacterium]|jgi:hypothetical protein
MYTALAANAGHPAVAALLGLGAAALAGAVVAMAWAVHARQIRLAEQLARRQFLVMAEPGAPSQQAAAAPGEAAGRVNGTGPASPGNGALPSVGGAGHPGGAHGTAGQQGTLQTPAGHAPGGQTGAGQSPPVVIEGPDTVVAGEQVRYRVRPSGSRKVVAWAAGGGAVAQSPDPAHPDELLLIADRPGDLTIIVRVRDGMTERRGTKAVTAVPEVTAPPPFTLRLFLNGWGLVAVTILIAGFAAALDALGNLSSSDFIALVCPLAALLSVVAVARGSAGSPASSKGTDRLAVHAGRAAEPLLPSPPPTAEAPVHNQPAL